MMTITAIAVMTATSSLARETLTRASDHRHRHSCAVAISVDSPSVTISAGDSTRFTVHVRLKAHGASARVQTSQLPAGVTAQVARHELTATGHATVTMRASPHASSGTFPFTVSARCGDRTAETALHLVVAPAPAPAPELAITPLSADLTARGSVRFCLKFAQSRQQRRERPHLTVTGLPDGATANLVPHAARDGCWYLTVQAHDNLVVGDYRFVVTIRRHHAPGLSAAAELHVGDEHGRPFTIAGDLVGDLVPGRSLSLDLRFTNPNAVPIALTSLRVRITSVDQAHAATCSVDNNYAVTQYGADPKAIVVPAKGTTSFSMLALPTAAWPMITMLDTDTFQDGCIGARLILAYSGTATGT